MSTHAHITKTQTQNTDTGKQLATEIIQAKKYINFRHRKKRLPQLPAHMNQVNTLSQHACTMEVKKLVAYFGVGEKTLCVEISAEAEVANFHCSVTHQKYICRLQVTMHNSVAMHMLNS